jgi:hypothetical protein
MVSLQDWRDRMAERSRQRMLERVNFPERDEAEERLRTLETLREWGVIDEDEYWEGRNGVAGVGAPIGRAWELRAEVRARDRRSRRRRP